MCCGTSSCVSICAGAPANLAVDGDEVGRIACPGRQLDSIDLQPVLRHAQIQAVDVDEKIWQVVKLWDELFDVGGGVCASVVRLADAPEKPSSAAPFASVIVLLYQ